MSYVTTAISASVSAARWTASALEAIALEIEMNDEHIAMGADLIVEGAGYAVDALASAWDYVVASAVAMWDLFVETVDGAYLESLSDDERDDNAHLVECLQDEEDELLDGDYPIENDDIYLEDIQAELDRLPSDEPTNDDDEIELAVLRQQEADRNACMAREGMVNLLMEVDVSTVV